MWQRVFGEAPRTTTSLMELRQVRPTRLVGLGGVGRYVGTTATVSSRLWQFTGQGDTVQSRGYALNNGGYLNLLPLRGGDWLITGCADTTGSPNSFDAKFFYVRVDSFGTWRGRPHYLPTYRYGQAPAAALPLPGEGALWAQSVNVQPYVPGTSGVVNLAQVVRLPPRATAAVRVQVQVGGSAFIKKLLVQ